MFSATNAFQKILKNKIEILLNHIRFNQTRSPPEKLFAPPPRQNQLYVFSGILISAPSKLGFAPRPPYPQHLLPLAGLTLTLVGFIILVCCFFGSIQLYFEGLKPAAMRSQFYFHFTFGYPENFMCRA